VPVLIGHFSPHNELSRVNHYIMRARKKMLKELKKKGQGTDGAGARRHGRNRRAPRPKKDSTTRFLDVVEGASM